DVGNGNVASINNGKISSHTEWETKSLGVQAILNKKILIFNPYLGASANKNFGDVSTTVTETGDLYFNGLATGQSPVLTGSASAAAKEWDIRVLAGFELSILPFLKLGVNGEFAGSRKLGAGIGLRAQFR